MSRRHSQLTRHTQLLTACSDFLTMRHVWSRPHEYHSSSTWLRDKQLQWLIKVIEEKKHHQSYNVRHPIYNCVKHWPFLLFVLLPIKIRNYKQLLAILFSLIKSIHWVVPKWKLKFIWTHNFIIVICTSKASKPSYYLDPFSHPFKVPLDCVQCFLGYLP